MQSKYLIKVHNMVVCIFAFYASRRGLVPGGINIAGWSLDNRIYLVWFIAPNSMSETFRIG